MTAKIDSNITDKNEEILREDEERSPSLFPIKYEDLYSYW